MGQSCIGQYSFKYKCCKNRRHYLKPHINLCQKIYLFDEKDKGDKMPFKTLLNLLNHPYKDSQRDLSKLSPMIFLFITPFAIISKNYPTFSLRSQKCLLISKALPKSRLTKKFWTFRNRLNMLICK